MLFQENPSPREGFFDDEAGIPANRLPDSSIIEPNASAVRPRERKSSTTTMSCPSPKSSLRMVIQVFPPLVGELICRRMWNSGSSLAVLLLGVDEIHSRSLGGTERGRYAGGFCGQHPCRSRRVFLPATLPPCSSARGRCGDSGSCPQSPIGIRPVLLPGFFFLVLPKRGPYKREGRRGDRVASKESMSSRCRRVSPMSS